MKIPVYRSRGSRSLQRLTAHLRNNSARHHADPVGLSPEQPTPLHPLFPRGREHLVRRFEAGRLVEPLACAPARSHFGRGTSTSS